MDANPYLMFLLGLLVILLGAEMLLREATRLASKLGIRPILIGLTVVSVGTSAPELAVGITAVSEGKGALAVGNIAGTNIVNILLILGLSAMIKPLPIRLLSIKLDVPIMIASALALIAMAADGILSRLEGGLLLLAALAYTLALVRLSQAEAAGAKREFAHEFGRSAMQAGSGHARGAWHLALLLLGMVLTVLGAEWLVSGAVDLARKLGVTDAFIGLTIVAVGTSAPELVTTLLATYKGDRDVAIGNLIGSSIYNILVILGLTVVAAPNGIGMSRDILLIDLPLAALVAAVCLPVFKSDRQVSRSEGTFFVLAYCLYVASLIWLRM